MKVFVVFGKTGEYSDRSEWPVCAYSSEDDAKTHVTKAQEYSDAWRARTQQDDWLDIDFEEQERALKAANPMDPCFSSDYIGTEYWYSPLELKERFTAPEVLQ